MVSTSSTTGIRVSGWPSRVSPSAKRGSTSTRIPRRNVWACTPFSPRVAVLVELNQHRPFGCVPERLRMEKVQVGLGDDLLAIQQVRSRLPAPGNPRRDPRLDIAEPRLKLAIPSGPTRPALSRGVEPVI